VHVEVVVVVEGIVPVILLEEGIVPVVVVEDVMRVIGDVVAVGGVGNAGGDDDSWI
jgi:hypothetical protein